VVCEGVNFHHRLCEDLNLTVPGSPRAEKKKKRKVPTRVDCPRCGLSLRDKFVQRKHVSSFILLSTVKSYIIVRVFFIQKSLLSDTAGNR
jgi:hypothetical protein